MKVSLNVLLSSDNKTFEAKSLHSRTSVVTNRSRVCDRFDGVHQYVVLHISNLRRAYLVEFPSRLNEMKSRSER